MSTITLDIKTTGEKNEYFKILRQNYEKLKRQEQQELAIQRQKEQELLDYENKQLFWNRMGCFLLFILFIIILKQCT